MGLEIAQSLSALAHSASPLTSEDIYSFFVKLSKEDERRLVTLLYIGRHYFSRSEINYQTAKQIKFSDMYLDRCNPDEHVAAVVKLSDRVALYMDTGIELAQLANIDFSEIEISI